MFASRPIVLSDPTNDMMDIDEVTHNLAGLSFGSPSRRVGSMKTKAPRKSDVAPKHGYYLGRDVVMADIDRRLPDTDMPQSPLFANVNRTLPSPTLSLSPASLLPSVNRIKTPSRRVSEPLPQAASTSPGDPIRPVKKGRASTAPTLSSSQCSGVAAHSAKRCLLSVGSVAPVSFHVDSLGLDGPVERYCYHHLKALLAQTSFFGRRAGVGQVTFSDYLSDDLMPITQALLKVEMERAVPDPDSAGQIHCFQVMNDDTPGYIHFKLGREWRGQCDVYELRLLGTWPPTSRSGVPEETLDDEVEVVQHVRRLEKLIHIEVADRSLRANFPGLVPDDLRKLKSLKMSMYMSGKRCDCGDVHWDIFTFPITNGREYEDHIFPAMKIMAKYVSECL
ncbi:hypothetical protein M408DRAFT_334145 [Serendipita vermifera MAFF 305830]|uniref:Uncharacterized protein n=1 Tax=Serendipita vermifera MAFF 305830 TaxID=933852 RepID=A0A0C3ALA5_SERVB|nr:hypothetical protein M408DRAFT_334145 [Serendipita vermifera MAFF 305830]